MLDGSPFTVYLSIEPNYTPHRWYFKFGSNELPDLDRMIIDTMMKDMPYHVWEYLERYVEMILNKISLDLFMEHLLSDNDSSCFKLVDSSHVRIVSN